MKKVLVSLVVLGLVSFGSSTQALIQTRHLDPDGVGVVVVHDVWIAPAAESATSCKEGAVADILSLASGSITQPDYARVVKMTLPYSKTCTGTVTVTGKDIRDKAVTENFVFSASITSVVGVQPFATISTIKGNATFIANASASDTINIGYGDTVALTHKIYYDGTGSCTAVKVRENKVDVAKTSVKINSTYNTVKFSGAFDGAKHYEIYYKAKSFIKPE